MPTLPTFPPVVDARLDALIQCLKARGCRITPQRVAVLKIILNSTAHPSAEEIHAQVQADYPMTSLATVYKTLSLLKEMGEVAEISLGHNGSRFDGHHADPHPHLICLKCNKIMDAEVPALESFAQAVRQATGFTITHQRYDFFGICSECQNHLQ